MLVFFQSGVFFREISKKIIYLIIVIPSLYLSFIALHYFIKEGDLKEIKKTDFIDKQFVILLIFSSIMCFAFLFLLEKYF